MDVDSLFALDAPSPEENTNKGPASSVFFDSVPTTGRASRFRQLFAQDPTAQQPMSHESENRPNMDRRQSVPVYSNAPKPNASVEDREGFQRIMLMLGEGGRGGGASGKPNMSNVIPSPIHIQF